MALEYSPNSKMALETTIEYKTSLTFTAHPTNTKMGSAMHNPKAEIDFYYESLLYNVIDVLLNDGHRLLEDIDQFYSWIGYDFDRSNLTAIDVAYSNAKSIEMSCRLYQKFNETHLNDGTLKMLLNSLMEFLTQKAQPLLRNKEGLSFNELLEKFEKLYDSFSIEDLEKSFTDKLKTLAVCDEMAHRMLIHFEKFRFGAFRGQVRVNGPDMYNQGYYDDIFRVLKVLNKFQDYAVSNLIIANFANIDMMMLLKQFKSENNLQNIGSVPLLESEEDIDYLIANLTEIMDADNIPMIMKAGSDDTKFNGLASSILSFGRLGYAMQNLDVEKYQKPKLFIGMGTSVERLGGPVFFRKMLGEIIGDNRSNRTIQGGELLTFSTTESTIEKLMTEIDISQVRNTITLKEIKEVEPFINEIAENYRRVFEPANRSFVNAIICDTMFGYVMDNFQAGSRYKRKIDLNKEGSFVNKFTDIMDHTRAIDFQTSWSLCGIHPEFAA